MCSCWPAQRKKGSDVFLLVLIFIVDKEVLEIEQKVFPASSDGKQALIEVYQGMLLFQAWEHIALSRALVETAAQCVTFPTKEKSSAATIAFQPVDKAVLPAEVRA